MQQFALTPTDGPYSLPAERGFVSRGSLVLMYWHYLDLPFHVGVISFCARFMFTYSWMR